MYPNSAPFIVSAGMFAIALALVVALPLLVRLAAQRVGLDRDASARLVRRVGIGALIWFAGFGLAAASGVLANFDRRPPPFLVAMLAVVIGAVLFARSRAGSVLAQGLPLWLLVGFQVFRVPLELVMHEAARSGVMPNQMSFGGWNFDIVSGLSAGLVGYLAYRGRAPRALVLASNVLGSTLLFVIVAIAVASTPVIHAFGEDPAALNTFVAYVPFIWLPAIMVAAALIGHVLVFRRLAAEKPVTGLGENAGAHA